MLLLFVLVLATAVLRLVSSMLGAVVADLWKRFVLSLVLDSKYFVFVFGIFSLFTSFDCCLLVLL